jgi:hypothetical protein
MLLENYSVPKVVMPEDCSVSYVNVADLPRFDTDNIHKIKLQKLLGDLSKDQRRALIAIMWIGRGDFAPDFGKAFEATKVISNQGDIPYLLGKGAIGFYLSIGLERLGIRLDSTENASGASHRRVAALEQSGF